MRFTLPLLLLPLFLSAASGQPLAADSSYLKAAKKRAVLEYERAMYRQEPVYEGNEYIVHDHRIKIHPFYPTDSLQTGTITYNDIPYHDVAMHYDIVRDEVAVRPPESGYQIQLRSNKISRFSLGEHQFIRLMGDSATGIPAGFHEILYNGNQSVLAHRVKTIHEDVSSGTYKGDYIPKDQFFIRTADGYHEVKTKRSLLSLFPDQSRALRKYLRTNKLKFNDAQREEAITKAVQQYDELHGQ